LLTYGETAPEKTHIYFQTEDGQQEIITYGDMLQNSLRVAQGLRDRGLKDGETVAIMQPTNPGFFYTFYGTLLAGGVPVPIYPPFRMHMLEAYAKTEAKILSNAEVRILVTFEQAEKLSRLLQSFVPSLKHVTTVAELMQPKILASPFHAKANSFAFIQYTSGSTSDPKGVLLTHHNLMANIRAYGKSIKVTHEDVVISWLPLYHDMGLIGMWLGSLYYGVPLVLMTPFSFLNHPERWLWAMHYHRGTISGAPNFAYELCVRKIEPAMLEGLDLSSWRVAANGAEKVYPRTLEQFATKFAPYGFKRTTLMPVYGLAESTVALAIPPPGREFRIDHIDRQKFEEERLAIPTEEKNALEFVGCGMPMEGHHIKITNDEYLELPERHIGNLLFKGPSSMQGYYHNSRATQAIYHEGWIDSGDLAYMADGEVFITGRRKDLIIKAGRNIYPAELEELVGVISGVRQGCVTAFGATDAKSGTEQLVVVAETREKNKDQRAKILRDINDAVATALDIVPDEVVLVAPHVVPKTSSGKLQRAACKKMYVEGNLGKLQIPAWLQIVRLGGQSAMRKCRTGINVIAKLFYTIYAALMFLLILPVIYLMVRGASRDSAAKICRGAARLLLKL
jgi:fatty-acyl-CoA synthase